MLDHIPQRKYVVPLILFLILFLNPASAQTFDPNTGEIITASPDSSMKAHQVETPLFDPKTGELLYPPEFRTPTEKTQPTIGDNVIPPLVPVTRPNLAGLDICAKAKQDAIAETSEFWYLGSIYLMGIPALAIIPTKTPLKNLWNLDPESARIYSECYEMAVKEERKKRVAISCGSCVGILVFLNVLAAY